MYIYMYKYIAFVARRGQIAHAASHAHILVECCAVESRHTQHHRRVHGGGETEAAIRIALLTLFAQAITSPELLPLQGLIRVTRLEQPALHAHQLL